MFGSHFYNQREQRDQKNSVKKTEYFIFYKKVDVLLFDKKVLLFQFIELTRLPFFQ